MRTLRITGVKSLMPEAYSGGRELSVTFKPGSRDLPAQGPEGSRARSGLTLASHKSHPSQSVFLPPNQILILSLFHLSRFQVQPSFWGTHVKLGHINALRHVVGEGITFILQMRKVRLREAMQLAQRHRLVRGGDGLTTSSHHWACYFLPPTQPLAQVTRPRGQLW